VEQLSELARSARRFYSLVCSRADKLWPDLADCTNEKTALDLKMFPAQPQPVKVELIRRSLANIGCGERGLTQRHYESMLQLARRNVTGGRTELPGGFVVRREYWNLIFARSERKVRFDGQIAGPVTLDVPGQTRFGRYLIEATIFEAGKTGFEEFKVSKTNCVEWFDLDEVKLPLIVRLRQAGDKFVPLGLAEGKKLGKFLTAQRVPHRIRRRVLIVADREKTIWVWPIRISEQAKVAGGTRRIVQLKISDSNGDQCIALPSNTEGFRREGLVDSQTDQVAQPQAKETGENEYGYAQ
jgi:tRNA(Ile)-lysidine synthase